MRALHISLAMAMLMAVSVSGSAQTQDSVAKFNNGQVSDSSIFDNGNVGIGTTSPRSKLEVNGKLKLTRYGTPTQYIDISGELNEQGVYASRGIGLLGLGLKNNDGTNLTPYMTILDGGNVGIGTTGPQAVLHVVNDAQGEFAGAGKPYTSGTLVLQGRYSQRAVGVGPSLTFALPANSDGTNVWEQARILAGPDNVNTQDAQGRLYLQVRSLYNPGTGQAWNWRTGLMISANGNVGVGTTSPGAKLEVNGNFKVSGEGSSVSFADGTAQSTAWTGVLCGGDYAESVDVTGPKNRFEPGDVMVVDPTNNSFAKSSEPYSTFVSGIYSTKPGVVGRKSTDPDKAQSEVPMAMIGIVPTKVSAENGSIRRGDLLVTSTMPGHAMKGTDRNHMLGAVVGKALGSLDSGTGVIDVLVTLQ